MSQQKHFTCSLGIRAVFYAADKFDRIPAAACGKTAPQTARQIDPEGCWVIAPVQWTGAMEQVLFALETRIEPIRKKHAANVYPSLQRTKIKFWIVFIQNNIRLFSLKVWMDYARTPR